MSRLLVIGLGVLLLVYSTLLITPAAQSEADMSKPDLSAAFEERFADAPQNLANIARIVATGGVPDQISLQEIGLQALQRAYSRPFPDRQPTFGHTLLREAMLAGNVAAARALVDAGADIGFNRNEMPFYAMRQIRGPKQVWFPDYSTGNALLALWLQSGGDTEATYPGESAGPLLLAAPLDNLEAILLLLDAGADPWARHPISADGTIMADSFHESTANANMQSLEVAFRVALAGRYRNAPPGAVRGVLERFEQTAEFLNGSTGPTAMAKIWALQKVLEAALPQMQAEPGPAARAILDIDVPPEVGGFFLAPGEVRSPPDPDQQMTTDNQTGQERWDE